MTSIKVNLKEIVKSPLEYGNMIEIPILIALLRKANDYYFNSDKVIFVDDVYDIFCSSHNWVFMVPSGK